MLDFKTNKYTVIKGAISKELASVAYKYLSLKRRVAIWIDIKTYFLKR